jgi:hypothetical protein
MRCSTVPRRDIQNRATAASMVKKVPLVGIENGRGDDPARPASLRFLAVVLRSHAPFGLSSRMAGALRNATLISAQQLTVNKVQNRP